MTEAAGWHILDCDPHAQSQDIRLVCAEEEEDASEGCAHLYQAGAVGTVVRLPESVGASTTLVIPRTDRARSAARARSRA